MSHIKINVRSLRNKVDDLKLFLEAIPYEILSITETWLCEDICYNLLQIDGYRFERRDRNENGGRVGCFIKDNISYVRRSDLEESELEIMWLEIRLHNHNSKLLGIVYRQPNSGNSFFNHLEVNLEKIYTLSKDVLILGDFN